MNEKIRVFLQKIAEDESLAARFSAVKDPDEAWELASSVQDGFTREEFVSAMEQIRSVVENDNDLSDEDLGKYAGGDIEISDLPLTTGASQSSATVTSQAAAATAAI